MPQLQKRVADDSRGSEAGRLRDRHDDVIEARYYGVDRGRQFLSKTQCKLYKISRSRHKLEQGAVAQCKLWNSATSPLSCPCANCGASAIH